MQRTQRKLGRIALLMIWIMCLGVVPVARGEDTLPKCDQRPMQIDPPWVDGQYWCLERVAEDTSAGEMAFTALAVAPDGTLYTTRPMAGEVLALKDTDGDGLPDSPQVVAQGLTMPNGLAYTDDGLYISGGANLYKLENGQVTTLVNDLPVGTGFWTGGLAVGTDKRIYVGIGAECDFCQQKNAERGAIWSFALDGSDKQIIATGLRQPADLTFRDGVLWTVDTARDGLTDGNLDELDAVTTGANFGWPYCLGANNHADVLQGDFDCTKASSPAFSFPARSNPLGLAAYDSETFPTIKGDLLVVLGGKSGYANIQGYTLAVVQFDANGKPTGDHVIIPEQSAFHRQVNFQTVQYQGSGFWPHHPFDVAVSSEGWIYVSVGGGEIMVLRPP